MSIILSIPTYTYLNEQILMKEMNSYVDFEFVQFERFHSMVMMHEIYQQHIDILLKMIQEYSEINYMEKIYSTYVEMNELH